MRTNLFYIVFSVFLLIFKGSIAYSQDLKPLKFTASPVQEKDSLGISPEKPILTADSTVTKASAQDTIKPSLQKQLLEGKINYKAEQYARLNQKKQHITLYDKAEIYYQDFELKAGTITMDYSKDEVYAGRIKDSAGNYTQYPYFKQGNNVVEPDSIRFNFKTQKALIWNSRTEQGDIKLKGEIAKKEHDSVYFVKNARFTTSKDIDNPEYYFLARKIKLVPGEKVVTGFTNMYIADVPTPIAIPFAFFPMTTTSQSGIILPTFQDTQRQGFSIQNGGLFLALSDYYNLSILGDYYTNGSYGMRFTSDYGVRYKFFGNVNVRFENLIQSERGFPDYSKTSIYNIQWTHTQDAKSNPKSRFSASVNLGSSRYFQQSINQLNIGSNLNNNLSSSISYSKSFDWTPQVNLSLTATHNQNTQTQQINMTLPTLQASMDRVYLFASKDGPKKGFIKNMNIQYNLRGENKFQTTDSLFFKPEMFKDARVGVQHSIPLSTNFKVFRYFSVTASGNYNEVWTLKTIEKNFNETSNLVETSEKNGFDAYRTYNFSSSIGTTVYGTFNFGEDKKIQAIRHTVRPSVSYSYTPSFEQYYDTYALDGSGRMADYTRFENSIFGAPSKNFANIVGVSLSNTVEAKMKSRDSTNTENTSKKVMLLNSLNFATSYNMAADSLRWAPVRVTGGTTLFDNKLAINFGATLDPYAINNAGRRIEKFNIENGGSLFRMTSANLTLNYAISSEGTKKNDESTNNQGLRNGGRADDLFGTNTDFTDRRQSQFGNEQEDNVFSKFYNAKLPWDLNFAYSLTFGNNNRERKILNNTVMVSGNIDLTPRWKMGVSTGYDFVHQGVTFTQFRFERDLLSWRMDFNWAPIGEYATWGFFIGVKSGILSDLKYEKRSTRDRVLR